MPLPAPFHVLNARELAREFAAAKPFRHVVIPDFLDRELCSQLLADFPAFDERHALNEMGQAGGKAVRMDVRDISPGYAELDRHIRSDAFLGFVSQITGIPDLVYDPEYVGGGAHENRDGQSLDPHVDFNLHPRTRWHRRLNLIVYLNPEWHDAWGGSLELHSDPWSDADDRRLSVLPLLNRCVIFETTETSWHGFSAITLPEEKKTSSRKSFAIYLYTRERPAEEVAPAHATIYVPQSLPAEWNVGRVLSAADVHLARNRFARMRAQLRFLYEREKQFSAQIEARDRALADARRAQRVNLQGYATQTGGAAGIWPDDWASSEVSLTFVPTRRANALTLDVWSPPQLDAPQELRIELDGIGYTQSLRPGAQTRVQLAQTLQADSEVSLTIRSARTWTPSADSASSDERALAFRLVSVVLQH